MYLLPLLTTWVDFCVPAAREEGSRVDTLERSRNTDEGLLRLGPAIVSLKRVWPWWIAALFSIASDVDQLTGGCVAPIPAILYGYFTQLTSEKTGKAAVDPLERSNDANGLGVVADGSSTFHLIRKEVCIEFGSIG